MTTFKLLSDLHLENHPDRDGFIDGLDPEGVDCLILAGDIMTGRTHIPHVLGKFCERYPEVIYVPGNHDYWSHTPAEFHQLLENLGYKHKNFHWLHNEVIEIGGVKVAGTTMWFPDDPLNVLYKDWLYDFQNIRQFTPWVYRANTLAQKFLRKVAGDVDIVVTHHMPHPESVAKRYRVGEYAKINRFFLCDMSDLIEEAQPAVWMYGHTHDCQDFMVGETRLLCNPKGRHGERSHPDRGTFNPKLLVKIEPSATGSKVEGES